MAMAPPLLGDPGPLLLLMGAMVADATVSPFAPWHGPGLQSVIRRIVSEVERRLNRPQRGERVLLIRGAVVAAALVAAAVALGLTLHGLFHPFPHGWVAELALVQVCLGVGETWHRAVAVRRALEKQGMDVARTALSGMTRRETAQLDEFGVSRAAIEFLCARFWQRVAAPALWYLLLDIPGLLLWTFVNAADEEIGHRTPRYENFGFAVARLHHALGVIPARACGGLLVAAAFFMGGAHPGVALSSLRRDARFHRSPDTGWPVAALAGALGLALGGPFREGGVVVNEAWVGQGRARANALDINRALALHGIALLLLIGALSVILALSALSLGLRPAVHF